MSASALEGACGRCGVRSSAHPPRVSNRFGVEPRVRACTACGACVRRADEDKAKDFLVNN